MTTARHGQLQQGQLFPTRQSKAWRIKRKTIESCGLVEEGIIFLTPRVYAQIQAAMEEMNHLEWLAYLLGEMHPKSATARVTNLLVPPQEVTTGSVKVLETPEHPKIIGTVHSHGNSGTAFSGVDRDHILANYPVGILAGKGVGILAGKGMVGVIRVKAVCGREATIPARVLVSYPQQESFRQVLRERVRRPDPSLYYPYYGGPSLLPYFDE